MEVGGQEFPWAVWRQKPMLLTHGSLNSSEHWNHQGRF